VECLFLKLHVYILFRNKYIFGVNMECRKIGTDCGKSFSTQPMTPARRIFATALLVGGALFASCKSEPATPAHANVTLPVVAPAQVGGEQNSAPSGARGSDPYLSNPYMGGSETNSEAVGTGRGATRSGKQGRGAKNPDASRGVVRDPFGGEEPQASSSEETQDAGSEQDEASGRGGSPPWGGGIVRPVFGGEEESQDAGSESEAGTETSQGGRGGAGNPYGEEVVRPVFGGEEEPLDAGVESNRGGSNPHNDSADAGSSVAQDGRGVTNPHEIRSDAGAVQGAGANASADTGGRIINPFEK